MKDFELLALMEDTSSEDDLLEQDLTEDQILTIGRLFDAMVRKEGIDRQYAMEQNCQHNVCGYCGRYPDTESKGMCFQACITRCMYPIYSSNQARLI